MRKQTVPFKNMCCVIPLRYGLLAWAYVKLIGAISASCYIVFGIYTLYITTRPTDLSLLYIMVSLEVALILDMSLSVTLIIGAHRKNYKLIRIYFYYAMYAVIAATLIIVVYVVYEVLQIWLQRDYAPWRSLRDLTLSSTLGNATIGVVYILIEMYIILLLRSEIIKLRNQSKFRLKNSSEPGRTFKFEYE